MRGLGEGDVSYAKYLGSGGAHWFVTRYGGRQGTEERVCRISGQTDGRGFFGEASNTAVPRRDVHGAASD